jgi:hypothetical protein
MSDLAKAAAAYARRQRQAAESEATRHAEAERAEQQDAALLRGRAREFFVFAQGHGASLFRRYDAHESLAESYRVGEYRYTRTAEMCVATTVLDGHYGLSRGGFAVTCDGEVYQGASVCQRRDIRNAGRKGIRDNVFVAVDTRRHAKYGNRSYATMNPDFVAAAAALLNPVPVSPYYPKMLTGIQPTDQLGTCGRSPTRWEPKPPAQP